MSRTAFSSPTSSSARSFLARRPIALGEKLRKENIKIKKKRDGYRDGRSRALAKLLEEQRAEAGADWDARRDAYLVHLSGERLRGRAADPELPTTA